MLYVTLGIFMAHYSKENDSSFILQILEWNIRIHQAIPEIDYKLKTNTLVYLLRIRTIFMRLMGLSCMLHFNLVTHGTEKWKFLINGSASKICFSFRNFFQFFLSKSQRSYVVGSSDTPLAMFVSILQHIIHNHWKLYLSAEEVVHIHC